MSVNTKAASASQLKPLAENQPVSQATQFTQYTLLDEVSGTYLRSHDHSLHREFAMVARVTLKPPGGHVHRPAFQCSDPSRRPFCGHSRETEI
jgi:hypothetical protein